MNQVSYSYHEYEVSVFLNLKSDKVKRKVLNELEKINSKSNTKLTYGIFDDNLSLKEKYNYIKHMIISIAYLKEEPVAFSYQYIISDNNLKILHQGLLLSYNNPGRDITFLNKMACFLFYQKYGEFYTTCLSSAPFAIGQVSRFFENVWPSPYSNNQKKPINSDYKGIAKICFDKYVKVFFPNPEYLNLDLNRFVVKSKAQEMGFEVDLRNMQRDDDLIVNLFSMFWINYKAQEIVLQIGVFNKKVAENFIKNNLFIKNVIF